MVPYTKLMNQNNFIILSLFLLYNLSYCDTENKIFLETKRESQLEEKNFISPKKPNRIKVSITKIVKKRTRKTTTKYMTIRGAGNGTPVTTINFNECGRSNKIQNGNLIFSIINGQRAVHGSWPWIGSLRVNNFEYFSYTCVATIISEFHIITAAHCLEYDDVSRYAFVAGLLNLNDRLGSENIYFVDKIIKHPLYANNLNDIAVVKLSKRIIFSEKVSPICLPKSSDLIFLSDKFAFVAGWGSTTGFNGKTELSNELLEARLKVMNTTSCGSYNPFYNNYYCGLDPEPKKSNICFGDSGTGLVYYDNETQLWVLYGVAAFVIKDNNFSVRKCNNEAPSLYAIVPKYITWIGSVTNL